MAQLRVSMYGSSAPMMAFRGGYMGNTSTNMEALREKYAILYDFAIKPAKDGASYPFSIAGIHVGSSEQDMLQVMRDDNICIERELPSRDVEGAYQRDYAIEFDEEFCEEVVFRSFTTK